MVPDFPGRPSVVFAGRKCPVDTYRQKRARLSPDSSVFALPIFPGRPSIVLALKSMPVACFSKKKPPTFVGGLLFALPIFPGSHPPSIVGVHELNFCVRDGNRWTLMTINTNYVDGS